METPELNGEIRYQNVSFRYGYRKWVLQDMSFSIKEGEHVALTGPNGSGKSSVARLLTGMYEPTSGTITIGNYDIKELSLKCIRSHVVYVPQEPVILSGSVTGKSVSESACPDIKRTGDSVESAGRTVVQNRRHR